MLTDLKSCDDSLQTVINQCRLLLSNLEQFSQLFDQNQANCTKLQLSKVAPNGKNQNNRMGETSTTGKITINMAKIKNKKTLKKVSKLKDFASNSFSYLQVILFQCKVRA